MVTEPATPVKGSGRAGRNLPAAIGVGLALVAVAVVSLVFYKPLFLLFVAAIVLLALAELARVLRARGVRLPVLPMAAAALSMVVSPYFAGPVALVASLGIGFVLTALWRMAAGQTGFVADVGAAVLCLVYVPFLAGFVSLLLRLPDGVEMVVTFLAVTVASDVGGYAVGVLVGRHPLAPRISPKKSREGFAGSVVLCLLVGAVCVWQFFGAAFWVGLVLGLIAAVVATAGDLLESVIKRDLGIKDMGAVLPGHGGVMDRLDSLLAVAPVAFLVLRFLLPLA